MTENCHEVILVGGFHEMIELCDAIGTKIVGIIDHSLKGEYLGHRILGRDEDAPKLFEQFRSVPVAVTPDVPAIRERLQAAYQKIGFRSCLLVHPAAMISRTATLGAGVVIHHGANISSMASLGDHVRINVGANVMHDVRVGAFTTIAPNAVVLGRVEIGRNCYIGANATILPGLRVGDRAVIGAGAVVTKAVPDDAVVKGNPAK